MPDLGRSRDRDPSKRNSITDRLLGSFNQARQNTTASIQRRTSSAANNNNTAALGASGGGSGSSSSKQNPVHRIREWLDTCNREHDHHCSTGSSGSDRDITTFRPVWLIDSTERCLVRAKPTDRYVTLSYVWGPGAGGHRRDGAAPDGGVQLFKTNLEEFQDALPDEDLPQTIVDAMWLSRKVGLKYLWVDRLCVVQDDEEDKANHIKHMAYIFANAYLTIVAAHGDINTGLLPLNPRKSAPPRGIRAASKPHEDLVLESKWSTRGWTVQEHVYARRSVFFFEQDTGWECHCETWQGSPNNVMKQIRGRQSCPTPPSTAAYAYRHSPWPDLDDYARIAMDYSARRLTVVDDTLKAFSGVTHVLSRVFPGGFVYGMPLMFLDVALLWRPQASIRRRAMSRPPFLPSWSWMGWWFDGMPVDLVLWRAAADYIEESKSAAAGRKSKRLQSAHAFKIKPIVTWNLTDRQATAPVANTGLQFRDMRTRKGGSAALPPGWSRSGSYFKHDSDESTTFRYPIPVEDPPEEGDYEPPSGEAVFPGPFLSFRTASAFFEVDYSATLTPRNVMNPPVAIGNIWAKSDRWAGQFRAHDGWLGIQSSNYEGDERLEFIAISIVTERRGSYLFNDEQFNANKDAEEFVDIVNVLWIERIGGIAYRRGLGHILERAWEAQAKEDVDILLG